MGEKNKANRKKKKKKRSSGSGLKKLITLVAVLILVFIVFTGIRMFNKHRLYSLAESYTESGRYDEAEAAYEQLSVSYKDKKADEMHKKIVDLKKSSTHFAEGIRLMNTGEKEKARDEFYQVIKDDKKNYSETQKMLESMGFEGTEEHLESQKQKEKDDKAAEAERKKAEKEIKPTGELIIWNEASSSSALSEGGIKHTAYNVIDGSIRTNWAEGKDDEGIGEWIQLDRKEEAPISRIVIYPGNYASSYWFNANNRVKKVKIELSDGQKISAELKDQFDSEGQEIKLPKPSMVKSIKIIIDDVYPGKQFNDTCISEVKVY